MRISFEDLRHEYRRQGNLFALANAITFCWTSKTPPQKWMADAVYELASATNANKTMRGRTGNPPARSLQTNIHLVRWAAVLQFKACDAGYSWLSSYERASEALRGTQAQGSAHTIRASYKRVTKERKAFLATAKSFKTTTESQFRKNNLSYAQLIFERRQAYLEPHINCQLKKSR